MGPTRSRPSTRDRKKQLTARLRLLPKLRKRIIWVYVNYVTCVSKSRNYQRVMQNGGSLPSSQDAVTFPCPEPDKWSRRSRHFLERSKRAVRSPRLYCTVRSSVKAFLAPRPTPRVEEHPLSAVRDCLFSIFAATLHVYRPSSATATWGRDMPWWQGPTWWWPEVDVNVKIRVWWHLNL